MNRRVICPIDSVRLIHLRESNKKLSKAKKVKMKKKSKNKRIKIMIMMILRKRMSNPKLMLEVTLMKVQVKKRLRSRPELLVPRKKPNLREILKRSRKKWAKF